MPMKDAFTELSAYDNHPPGDSGSQLYERSKDFGLLQVTREQIAEIDDALAAIQAGSYGYCRVCGRSISAGRLAAMPPRTLLCLRCKRNEEDRDLSSRPVEEELLYPPFGRTFTDETDSVILMVRTLGKRLNVTVPPAMMVRIRRAGKSFLTQNDLSINCWKEPSF